MKTTLLTTGLIAGALALATGGAAAETVRFTLGTSNSATDFSVRAMEHWKELMEERSNGELQMTIIPGAALGSGTQILQQLSTNEVQVSIAGPAIIHQMAQQYQCMEAEFVYTDADHGYRVWTGALGEELSGYMESEFDITITGVGLRGARQLTANRPIVEPSDLEGVKIRVTNALRSEIFAAYGALPGPMAFSELYGGLRQGVFDAQENPIPAIYGQRFFEVQSALNLTNHVQSYYILTSNNSFVESLSDAHRAIYEETAAETMDWLNELVRTETDVLVEEMTAAGIELVEPNIEAFREIAAPIVTAFAEANCRPGILDEIEAAR
eukprot:g17343.t1